MKVKHKFLSVLMAVCMFLSMNTSAVLAVDDIPNTTWTDYAAINFEGGVGTEQDPYQIATAEQLAKLSKDVSEGTNYQGTYFVLTENINLSSHRWVPIGLNKWGLSGTSINKSFQGFLDGNHKTISGLIVDDRADKYSAGLFGNIRNIDGNTVGAKDLTISSANIYATEDGLEQLHAGILAGYAQANPGQKIVFENISVSGTVVVESTAGQNNVGGMIGYGDRIKATNCKAENISVTGASNSGGFIGLGGGSSFENCKASGTVSGTWGLGGFVGYSYSASRDGTEPSVYEKCAADVKIEGSDWRLGGFAGYAEYGKFVDCIAFGDVTSVVDEWDPKVGGFIGQSDHATADECHTTGMIISASLDFQAGGFIGFYDGGTFTNCSFDNEKNNGLETTGNNSDLSGIKGDSTNGVLANICEDYYGGHEYKSEWTIDTTATCTTDGSKSHHCERCDAKNDITVIQATGHGMTELKNEKEATCTEEGYTGDQVCKVCGEVVEKGNVMAKITHSFKDGKCIVCGAICQGETELKNGKEATCTEEGYTGDQVCKVCGEVVEKGNVIAKIAHSFKDGKCIVCGAICQGETELKNGKEATCTEEGYTGDQVCKVCGEVVEKGNVIAKIAHSFKNGKCIICGAIDSNYVRIDSTQATGSNKNSNNSTQTEDLANPGIWFAIMMVAGIILIGTASYSKKKKYNK